MPSPTASDAATACLAPRFAPCSAPSPTLPPLDNHPAGREALKEKNRRVMLYGTATAIGVFGLAYASVPLYKVFCQATGFGGTTQREENAAKIRDLRPVEGRVLRISFVGDTADTMPWSFKPEQRDVKVVPGETALAFYQAKNKTDKAITGVATYNVFPFKAGLYFHKIQCFCFEQQRLLPREEIDMPVFFYIDPEFLDDPAMDGVNSITLSYTFFKTDEEDVEGEEKAAMAKAASAADEAMAAKEGAAKSAVQASTVKQVAA